MKIPKNAKGHPIKWQGNVKSKIIFSIYGQLKREEDTCRRSKQPKTKMKTPQMSSHMLGMGSPAADFGAQRSSFSQRWCKTLRIAGAEREVYNRVIGLSALGIVL